MISCAHDRDVNAEKNIPNKLGSRAGRGTLAVGFSVLSGLATAAGRRAGRMSKALHPLQIAGSQLRISRKSKVAGVKHDECAWRPPGACAPHAIYTFHLFPPYKVLLDVSNVTLIA